MPPGIVYLIGAGPGDPSLITVRGAEVLARCDVVLYDALAHPALLELMKPNAEARFVGKRGGEESEPQDEINRELVALAKQGKVVGRLKGGDPMLFARGAEEAEFLAANEIAFEIVPGISSPIAISSYAGIPLTHRDMASSVLFLTGTPRKSAGPDGHDWSRLATRAGTICILMGMSRIDEIARTLIENGRDPSTPTAVVQWGARPQQRTVTAPLVDIAKKVADERVGSPAIIVIGQVVSLRETLRWFDRKPLFGKRIVVTRAQGQGGDLARALRERGAEPTLVPTIAIAPPPDPDRLATAVRDLATYDWVAITSPNGVSALFAEIDHQQLDARAFGRAKVAAIGPGTAAALRSHGVRADLVAKEFRGEGLAEALLASPRTGSFRVLVPRALVAREAMPETLRAAGAEVDVVPAYTTVPPDPSTIEPLRKALSHGEVDVITLTSSSTVEHLVELLGNDARDLLANVTLASIGPITTATAERLGLTVKITASEYSIPGLLAAMEHAFSPSSHVVSSPS